MTQEGTEPQPEGAAPESMRATLSQRRLILVMAGVMLGMLLSALDQTIVGTAMPRIIAELNGLEHYAWVFTAYMLASTVMVPIYGKLSDIYGRRPFFLAGMALFLAGSALSGTSQDMTQLILYRAVQGLGAGAMMPIVQAIVADIFPPAERGKWQGAMMAVFGLASIVGPTAGGWITDNWGWRWVFYVNMPVGALAIMTAGIALPRQSRHQQHRIDYPGAATLVAGAVPMLLAFSWAGTQYAWESPQIIGLLAFAAAMFAAFFLIESRAAEPIISPSLFRSSIFSVSVLASFLLSVGFFGAIMYLPLFVQGVIGDTATGSGTVLTPMMLGFMASSLVGGLILSRTGRYKSLALVGFAFAAFGTFLLSRMDVTATNGLVLRNMIVTGLGMGVLMSLFTIVVQNAFPFSQLGQVTASLQFFRSIGGTIGVAILGTVMTNSFQESLQRDLPQTLKQVVPPGQLGMLENPEVLLAPQATAKIQQGFAAFGPQGQALFNQVMEVIRVSLATAVTNVFLVSTGILVLAMLSTLFLREIPLRRSHSEEVATAIEPGDREAGQRRALRAAGTWAKLLPAIGALVVLLVGAAATLGVPRGTVIAQIEWRNGTSPKATVQWIGDNGASAGTANSVSTAKTVGTATQTPVAQDPPASAAGDPAGGATAPTNQQASGTGQVAAGGTAETAATREYVVKPGDTLAGIAAQVYGDSSAWQRIVALNAGKIGNPNVIMPGEKLELPAR